MRVFVLAVGYGGLVVAPGGWREGLVALRLRVCVPDFHWGALWGDSAGRAFGVVNVLSGLFLALLHGLAFAGCDGADAFGRVAPAPDEDACPPVGAVVLVDYPGFALFRDFGGGDVAKFAWLERAPCHDREPSCVGCGWWQYCSTCCLF